MGGIAALAGAMVLGPRIGKFDKDGKPQRHPGHNIPMAILGAIILVFGWFGFNGASTLAATDLRFAVVVVNTFIAPATGCLAAMFLVWKMYGQARPVHDGQRHAGRPGGHHRSLRVRQSHRRC